MTDIKTITFIFLSGNTIYFDINPTIHTKIIDLINFIKSYYKFYNNITILLFDHLYTLLKNDDSINQSTYVVVLKDKLHDIKERLKNKEHIHFNYKEYRDIFDEEFLKLFIDNISNIHMKLDNGYIYDNKTNNNNYLQCEMSIYIVKYYDLNFIKNLILLNYYFPLNICDYAMLNDDINVLHYFNKILHYKLNNEIIVNESNINLINYLQSNNYYKKYKSTHRDKNNKITFINDNISECREKPKIIVIDIPIT